MLYPFPIKGLEAWKETEREETSGSVDHSRPRVCHCLLQPEPDPDSKRASFSGFNRRNISEVQGWTAIRHSPSNAMSRSKRSGSQLHWERIRSDVEEKRQSIASRPSLCDVALAAASKLKKEVRQDVRLITGASSLARLQALERLLDAATFSPQSTVVDMLQAGAAASISAILGGQSWSGDGTSRCNDGAEEGSRGYTPTEREQALLLVAAAAISSATTHHFVQAGVVPIVVGLVRAGCAGERLEALKALQSLVTQGDSAWESALKAGARRCSRHALAQRCLQDGQRKALLALAALLQAPVEHLTNDMQSKELMLEVLEVLAGQEHTQGVLLEREAEVGTVGAVIRVVARAKMLARGKAADVLRCLAARDDAAVTLIVRAHAVPPLVALSSKGSSVARRSAVATLLQLSGEPASLADIVHGVPGLVGLLDFERTAVTKRQITQLLLKVSSWSRTGQDAITRENGVTPLLAMMRTDPEAVGRLAAIRTIERLTRAAPNAEIVARGGAIPPVVQMLRESESSVEREAAALALGNLARASECRGQVRGSEWFAPALDLLREGGHGERQAVACLLASAAHGSLLENEHALMTAGAVSPLVALLRDPASCADAAVVLGWLAGDVEAAAEVAREGAIPCLVEMLRRGNGRGLGGASWVEEEGQKQQGGSADVNGSPDGSRDGDAVLGWDGNRSSAGADARANAAGALTALAYESTHAAEVTQEGAIAPLVQCLQEGLPKEQAGAAECLARLASHGEAHHAEMLCVGIPALMALLPLAAKAHAPGAPSEGTDQSDLLERAAVGALGQLAVGKKAQCLMLKLGVPRKLVALLCRRGEGEALHEVKGRVAEAVARLAEGGKRVQMEFVRHGAIPPLVAMLHQGGSSAKGLAATALGALAGSSESRVEVVRAGAVPWLQSVVQDDGVMPRTTQESAAQALWRISLDTDHLLQEGRSAELAPVLGELRTLSAAARGRAATAVEGLQRDSCYIPTVAQPEAIAPLALLLREESSVGVRKAVAALETVIGVHDSDRWQHHQSSIRGLQKMMREASAPGRDAAAWALVHTTSTKVGEPVTTQSRVQASSVTALLEVMGHGTPRKRGEAARAMARLAVPNAESRLGIVQAGALPHLVRLLQDGDLEGQMCAVEVLAMLSREVTSRDAIAEAGAIPQLVRLLRQPQDAQRAGRKGGAASVAAQRSAADAIAYLALADRLPCKIASEGGIEPLHKMLHETEEVAKEISARALRNLARESSIHHHIGRRAVLLRLVSMCKHARPEGRACAAGALGSLARSTEMRDAIAVFSASVPNLLNMLHHCKTAPELEAATAALLNLTYSERAKGSMMKGSPLRPLVRLLEPDCPGATDPAMKNACLVLSQLATSDNARLAIVRNGGLLHLRRLAAEGSTEVRSPAAATLMQLSEHESIRATIKKAGGLPGQLSFRTFTGCAVGQKPKVVPTAFCCRAVDAIVTRCAEAIARGAGLCGMNWALYGLFDPEQRDSATQRIWCSECNVETGISAAGKDQLQNDSGLKRHPPYLIASSMHAFCVNQLLALKEPRGGLAAAMDAKMLTAPE
ncbi:hypothetical protein CYMTET_12018 [Cymbomonas tetramitiformis]|uniref:Uncharacterized protein n=1 Tax=Cymbomonas tetramitiformis TaxID=36881 RepID=A0AAE0LCH2_9CHLO|nr:hypothetical protein CYMTET_12018 [Cymbomonas tetramitiformis]